ncbi:MAG: hypothetical protein SCM11_11955, partial [Bacillota bacterium]|nr:hypothetical protein [Bacillota bacterium]
FWKIVTINLMYVVLSLPAFLLTFLGASFVVQAFFPNLTPEVLAEIFEKSGITLQEGISLIDFANVQILQMYILIAMLLVGLNLVIVGPVHAGIVYILRNYSREEHAFVWMDFKEHARNNMKQSFATSGISLLFTILFVVNYAFYNSNLVMGSNILRTFLQTVIVILFIIWCMMQLYLYPMMITFNLKIKQLLRNCLMFAILRLPLNLLILLASFIILFVIPGILLFLGYGISVLGAFLWYVFFAIGFNLFMTTFFSYRALDKHMIQRIKAAESLNEEDEEEEEEEEEADDETEDEEEADANNKSGKEEEPEPGFVRSPY